MLRKSSDPEVQKLRDQIELKPGMKVNKLTLVKKEGSNWICDCDCGTKGFVVKRAYRLKNELIGNVQDHVGSCGCKQKEYFQGKANRNGTIESKYKEVTYGGSEILYKTDYIDYSLRETVVICKCRLCGRIFPTTVRHGESCGCLMGREVQTLEHFIMNHNCKSKNEQIIYDSLIKLNIPFIYNKKFDECKDQTLLPFDFFVNNQYIIEYDGEQHFRDISFFNFETTRKHDLIKNKYCFENNIPIIRIPYTANYNESDLLLKSTRFLLTEANEAKYYS